MIAVKRTDAIRMHSEEAAALQRLADAADGPGRPFVLEQAREQQDLADAARLYDYPHNELED